MDEKQPPEAESGELSPEELQEVQESTRANNERLRAVLRSEDERTEVSEERLLNTLNLLVNRAGDDPEMIHLLNEFLGSLEWIVYFGDSDEPLSHRRREDFKSVLIGATMASQVLRTGGMLTDMQPEEEHVRHLENFLEITDKIKKGLNPRSSS